MKKRIKYVIVLPIIAIILFGGVSFKSPQHVSNDVYGDINYDGVVDGNDLNEIIKHILRESTHPKIDTFKVNGVSFTMVFVEGGAFAMGGTFEQEWYNYFSFDYDEYPVHRVQLSSYSIGQTEVTQDLWQAVMGSNPSYFSFTNKYNFDLQHPVENVSWYNVQEFITRLNLLTGLTFRLPTEAEWEYAARGGNQRHGFIYAGSDIIEDIAWNNDSITHTVATKAANELGLYDMSGNVWEWCQDWYDETYYSISPILNPIGPDTGSMRVRRGGCYGLNDKGLRIADRGMSSPTTVSKLIGFRLAI